MRLVACVLAVLVVGVLCVELDPVLQKRLDESKLRAEREAAYKQAVWEGQRRVHDEQRARFAVSEALDAADEADKQRRDLSPDERTRRSEGRRFLAQQTGADVHTLSNSAILYRVLDKGEGEPATPSTPVTYSYTLGSPTGERYTEGSGTHAINALRQATPCALLCLVAHRAHVLVLAKALALMAPGDRWELYVPSDEAYGERGSRGRAVPSHATLLVQLTRHPDMAQEEL